MNSDKPAEQKRGARSKSKRALRTKTSGVEVGTHTDAQAARTAAVSTKKLSVDPKRLNTTGEPERSSDRGSLVSYFRDIADIPTLKKEEEVMLAKEIEAATLAFRENMISIPWSAKEAVRIWNNLRAENRATGKMCESFGSGSPEGEDLGARVDASLQKIENLLQTREAQLEAGRTEAVGRTEKRISRVLKEADLLSLIHI